ncbi:MAG TPA: CinA family protein [Burkholderiales bacterium]|nr:CinA family protein [Burkholderiales bacterium]
MELEELALKVGMLLKQKGFLLATAESCTGGWTAEVLTSIPGSSEWYERGFITYSNLSKREMLGVNPDILSGFGAVSMETAKEMAKGALRHSRADVALSITGIAGPGGGSIDKPVGTVCFAWAAKGGKVKTGKKLFDGDRKAVRRQAVEEALNGLLGFC